MGACVGAGRAGVADAQLDRLGVTVAERVPTAVHPNVINARYPATKAGRGARTLDLPCDDVLDAEA